MNKNIMDSPITSLKPGRTLSMTHERHGRACDGRDLSVKFNLAEKVKSDPRAGGIGGRGHCVLKKGFTPTFPMNQDVTVKLKSELIFIKF